MYRGDDRALTLTLTDEDGSPVDLTAAAVRFTAKRNIIDADDAAVLSKTVGSGVVLVNAPGGIARIDIAAADTAAFAGRVELVWDIQVTRAGLIRTVDAGTLTVLPDVSRTAP